jgi:hypothetical protein
VSEHDLAMRAHHISASEEPVPAPRARRTLAGLIDVAIIGLLSGLYLRWKWRGVRDAGPDRNPARQPRWLRLLSPAPGILREQLGSPGAWIVGLRTVDRRTGHRVALWRTLAVALLAAVTEAGRRHLMPAPRLITQSENEDLIRDVEVIRERYADDDPLCEEATMRLYEQRRIGVNLWRVLPAIVVPALINNRLRRRLAPTVVVLARPRPPHRP